MDWKLTRRFLVLRAVLFAQPAPDAAALQSLLDRTRAGAMRYQGRLPDFTCTKVTIRKEDDSGKGTKWRTRDRLEEVVSFASGGRAFYKLIKLNGRPTTRARPHGIVEDALLGSAIVPLSTFGANAMAQFKFDHWDMRADHRIAVIDFNAVGVNYPDGKKRYELKITGKIFFDDTAGNLVRLESISTGPAGYPFGATSIEIDYAPVPLSGRELILPTSATISTNRGKRRHRNEMQFTEYRKYEADVTVKFDATQ